MSSAGPLMPVHTARALRRALLLKAGLMAAAGGMPAVAVLAAEQPVTPPPALQEVIVQGVRYRDRADTTDPVLRYDLPYFQQFEPLTVGDMLKRTPSVAFLSDVLEYDGVRLRGLDSSYTQILINGEKVPGAGIDRSFFVDRLPAELVERIEIVRSTSADRGAEGVAGTLNVVLKDDASFDGGFLRGGGLYFDDGEAKGTFGAAYAGSVGDSRFWLGANVQGRYNPKAKTTDFFNGDNEFNDERELESDVRDGTDYSVSGSWTLPLGAAKLDLNGFYVQTDRDETENVQIFEDNPLELVALEGQEEVIDQRNLSTSALLTVPFLGGTTKLRAGYAKFKDDVEATAFEADAGDPLEAVELETLATDDEEVRLGLAHTWPLSGAELTGGVDWLDKQRDASNRLFEIDSGALDEQTAPNGVYAIEERRVDPYLKLGYGFDGGKWEIGARFENTDIDVSGTEGTATNEFSFVSPSGHVVFDITPADRISLSVARTTRRPDFDLLAPYEVEESPGDEDIFTGNPLLDPDLAWGTDLGYERRLGAQGVVGVNAFYRKVDDVVEFVSTGQATPDGGLYYTSANVGDGDVWGVELDLSTPLARIGLPNTGFFLNYSWLDSEIIDPVLRTKRRFNNQPEYVFNGGFIHDLPVFAGAFGVTYRQQGEALQSVLGELRETTYDGDLEVFLEKRFGERIVARLTATNLLDSKKKEEIFEYDGDSASEISANMLANDIDEIERESEQAGPVYQLILRAAF